MSLPWASRQATSNGLSTRSAASCTTWPSRSPARDRSPRPARWRRRGHGVQVEDVGAEQVGDRAVEALQVGRVAVALAEADDAVARADLHDAAQRERLVDADVVEQGGVVEGDGVMVTSRTGLVGRVGELGMAVLGDDDGWVCSTVTRVHIRGQRPRGVPLLGPGVRWRVARLENLLLRRRGGAS